MARCSKYKNLAHRLLANAVPADNPLPDGTYCLLYQGWARRGTHGGYCAISIHERGESRRNVYTHRLSYTVFVGPIPYGHDVDHKCKVRNCINPAHLQTREATEHRQETGFPRANPPKFIPGGKHINGELFG
jgi:hypothetical protein